MEKEKKFTHNKIERCILSKKKIDTEFEKYSIVLDCDKDTIYSIGFYKGGVLQDLIKGNVELIKKELLERHKKIAKGMLGQLFNKQKEVYQIG